MIAHIGIRVKDYPVSKAFYSKILPTLNYRAIFGKDPLFFGFGTKHPDFWITQADEQHPAHKNVHVAFLANDPEMVKKFHAAALDAGAKDNGAPGPRPEYGSTYYGGFVIDPDGNNIEALCHIVEKPLAKS